MAMSKVYKFEMKSKCSNVRYFQLEVRMELKECS